MEEEHVVLDDVQDLGQGLDVSEPFVNETDEGDALEQLSDEPVEKQLSTSSTSGDKILDDVVEALSAATAGKETITDIIATIADLPIVFKPSTANHPAWPLIQAAAGTHGLDLDLKMTIKILTRLGKARAPIELCRLVLNHLNDLKPEIRNATLIDVESLAFSLTLHQSAINSSLVRMIHEKVIRDLPDYSSTNMFSTMSTLSYLQPFPSTGMTILCWDRATELLPFCSAQELTPLLRALVRLSPTPPKRLLDAVYEKCEEFAHEMDAKCLARAFYWLYKTGYTKEDYLGKKLAAHLDDKLHLMTLSNLHQWATAYAVIGEENTTRVNLFVEHLLSFSNVNDVGSVTLANAFRLMAYIEDPCERVLSKLASKVSVSIRDANGQTLTSILGSLAMLKMRHDLSNDCIKLIEQQKELLQPGTAVRMIVACCKLRKPPHKLKKLALRFLTNDIIEKCDSSSMVFLLDGLGKMGVKERALAERISVVLARELHRRDLGSIALALKRALDMGSTSPSLFESAKPHIIKKLPTATPAMLSYIFDSLGMLSQKKIYDVDLMGKVVATCIKKVNEFSCTELARLVRWTGKMQLRDLKFISAVHSAVVEKQDAMSLSQLCWIVWGMAKVNFPYSPDAFALIADRVSTDMEDLHLHDLCRFMYACGRSKYQNRVFLQRVGDFIVTQDPVELNFPGMSILAWSFARQNFWHEAFLTWMVEKTPRILNNASPQSISHIMFALKHFDFQPSEELLSRVMYLSRGMVTSFRPFEICLIAQSLSRFGVDLDENFVVACSKYLERNLKNLDGVTVCSIVWTLNKYGYNPPENVVAHACNLVLVHSQEIDIKILGQFLWALGRSGYKPTALLEMTVGRVTKSARKIRTGALSSIVRGFSMCQFLSERMVQSVRDGSLNRLSDFSSYDLAGLVWGLANLGYREEEFFARVSVVCVEKLVKMNATDLFTLIWAFARAGRPAEVFIGTAYRRLGAGEMKDLSAPQLVSLSWAIAKIGIYDQELMCMLQICVQKHLESFNVKGISTVMWAFGTVSHDPGNLIEDLTSRIGKRSLERFPTWLALTHVLWACARLLYRPPTNVIDAALDLLHKSEGDYRWKGGQREPTKEGGVEARHLLLCLWSLAVFGKHRTELVEGLAARVDHLDILEDMQEEQKQQAAQCILAATASGISSPLSDLPSHYVAEIMASWRTVVKWNAEQEPSLFHRNVTAALSTMSIAYEEKVLTEDRCMLLDIFVPFQSEEQGHKEYKGVALELYGPQHLTANTFRQTGKVVLRQTLIQDRGYRVLPLLYSEWQDEQDAGRREIYLQGKLVNAGVISNSVEISPNRFDCEKLDNHLSMPVEEEEDLGAFVDALEDDLMLEQDVTSAREAAATSVDVPGPTPDTSW